MRIEWTLEKKRGNLRPKLIYTTELDAYERGLCLPMVRIETTIPEPPESFASHCWPGEHERSDWTPDRFHRLATPSHKTGFLTETLTLPWREDNRYPEVEAGLSALQRAFETMLQAASASEPMTLGGELETTTAAKQQIASAFLAERIVQAAKQGA